jgi:hypothetical protein
LEPAGCRWEVAAEITDIPGAGMMDDATKFEYEEMKGGSVRRIMIRVFFTNCNRNLYRGYRSYRCGAVIKTAG